ncbi:DHA2 family efflux MFS transporter permease subunit [Nocardia niigatensis]
MSAVRNPWSVLGALCVGFFVIVLDMTIVAVANPAILTGLHTDMSKVIWVTSAYLLTYAVPLLITGRLGDRFGPKKLYLAGLVVFTVASLGCALAGSIGALIAARAVQGLGAALIAPQTMAVISRIFPADKRGAAMGVWGGIAGVATLVGPILGGVLIDNGGWQWIFYVNLPIGVAAFVLGAWLIPSLPTNGHRFDVPGVLMVAVGMSALVFGLQQGNAYHWAGWVWALIVGGLAVIAIFLVYQGRTTVEPLVPLGLFRDRNFALGNVATAALGAAMTAQMVPSYFYLQAVRDFSPTKAALVFAPMAIVTVILSPTIGKLSDKLHPRYLPTFGFALFAAGLLWFIRLATPHGSIALISVVAALLGVASACIWAPLPATSLRNLPLPQMGAASGVYNNNRQLGSVLGSAGIGALLTARMSAHSLPAESGRSARIPDTLKAPFNAALTDSLYLTAALLIICLLAAAFFTTLETPARHPSPKPMAEANSGTTD